MINSAGGALLVVSAVLALFNLANMCLQRQMGRSVKLLFSHEEASLDTIRIGLGETIAFGMNLNLETSSNLYFHIASLP